MLLVVEVVEVLQYTTVNIMVDCMATSTSNYIVIPLPVVTSFANGTARHWCRRVQCFHLMSKERTRAASWLLEVGDGGIISGPPPAEKTIMKILEARICTTFSAGAVGIIFVLEMILSVLHLLIGITTRKGVPAVPVFISIITEVEKAAVVNMIIFTIAT